MANIGNWGDADEYGSTPMLDRFLAEMKTIVEEKDGKRMERYLIIEPPYKGIYRELISEVRINFPAGKEDSLETKCTSVLGDLISDGELTEGGPSWSSFLKVVVQWAVFLRDADGRNLLGTFEGLGELLMKCNSGLVHPTMGILTLPTVISYSRVLARLAIGLDKEPELVAHLATLQSADEGGNRETLPEQAANILRQAFVTCLNDRPSGSGNKIEGKKRGVYIIANLCLKILFQCRKHRNAEQIFSNIYNSSPPLSMYPKSERTTYLYYLGRFLYSNNHVYQAQLSLQEAYNCCPPRSSGCLRQRHLILVFLIASNIILGRFPSEKIYALPEASRLREHFQPLCKAISIGDLASFRRITDVKSKYALWMIRYRILLQLRNRCEILVWLSLSRRAFLLTGNLGDVAIKKAPTLDLRDLVTLARFLERQAMSPQTSFPDEVTSRHMNHFFAKNNGIVAKLTPYVDPDLEGAGDYYDDNIGDNDGLYLKDSSRVASPSLSSIGSNVNGHWKMPRNGNYNATNGFGGGNGCRNGSGGGSCDDKNHVDGESDHGNNDHSNGCIDHGRNNNALVLPTMAEIEAVVSALIDQGFLNGFLSHNQQRFAVLGAKHKGALPAGWPPVWQVVKSRCENNSEIAGWKKDQPAALTAMAGGETGISGELAPLQTPSISRRGDDWW